MNEGGALCFATPRYSLALLPVAPGLSFAIPFVGSAVVNNITTICENRILAIWRSETKNYVHLDSVLEFAISCDHRNLTSRREEFSLLNCETD